MHDCGFDPGRRGRRSGEAKRVRPHPNPTRLLIISYPPRGSILTPSDASRRADRISRGLSLFIPCYRELASLLSRINSLLCLLGNLFVSNWIPSVFWTDFRKKRLKSENFPVFFPVSREPVFQETWRRPRQAAEEPTVGTGHATAVLIQLFLGVASA